MNERERIKELSSFPERVIYLLNIKWKGTKRGFCQRYRIGKTTFYRVYNNKNEYYSDYVIEIFARAFSVSFDFLKYGGTTLGYYKPKGYITAYYQEGMLREAAYGYGKKKQGRPVKDPDKRAKADIEFRMNDEEQVLEIILKIKYRDMRF